MPTSTKFSPTLPPEQIDEILDEAPPAPLPLFFVVFLRNLLALLRRG